MKFYLISDNIDTLTGMRLAGIDGEVAHTAEETQKALLAAMDRQDVAVILMTEKLISLSEYILAIREAVVHADKVENVIACPTSKALSAVVLAV